MLSGLTGVAAATSAAVVFEEEVGLLLLLLTLLLLSELPYQDRLTVKLFKSSGYLMGKSKPPECKTMESF